MGHQAFNHRDDTVRLLCRTHPYATRSGALAPDVQEGGAFFQHLPGLVEQTAIASGKTRFAHPAYSIERVVRDVQDTHHLWCIKGNQFTLAVQRINRSVSVIFEDHSASEAT